MKVKISYLGSVGVVLAKRGEEVDIGDTATLSDLLMKLVERHGEKFKEEIFKPGCADLKTGYVAMVNGVLISQLQGIQTKLNPNDTIFLMPAISGG